MGTKFLHQAIELVAILTLGEGEIIFLKSVTTAKVTTLQQEIQHLRIFVLHRLVLEKKK